MRNGLLVDNHNTLFIKKSLLLELIYKNNFLFSFKNDEVSIMIFIYKAIISTRRNRSIFLRISDDGIDTFLFIGKSIILYK